MFPLQASDLVFNIVEQRLTGTLDRVIFNDHAVSGGRAGTKLAGAANPFIANNPFATRIKLSPSVPGGPLPLCRFTLQIHETRQNWIRLLPAPGQNLGGRSGFAIHGRGERGSDGCIVPMNFEVVKQLHRLTAARAAAQQPAPTLQVIATGDLGRFEAMMHTA